MFCIFFLAAPHSEFIVVIGLLLHVVSTRTVRSFVRVTLNFDIGQGDMILQVRPWNAVEYYRTPGDALRN